MRPFSAILILLLAAFLWSWGHVCHTWSWAHHEMCYKDDVATGTASNTLALRGTDLKSYQQFSFVDSTANVNLTDNNKKFLNDVTAYFKANPDQTLMITGRYRPGEQPSKGSIFENLGLERADAIRKLLVARGIPADKISIQSELVQRGSNFDEPVSFTVQKPAPKAKADKPLASTKFTFKNMTYSDANFDVNSAVFNPGTGFRNYADSVAIYMKENSKSTLKVIGHTDSDGSDEYNMDLGQRRAQAVKQYFQGKGIKNSIATASEGERRPTAPNDTAANKRKNRRVVVQIND